LDKCFTSPPTPSPFGEGKTVSQSPKGAKYSSSPNGERAGE